jgi:hypothetical protein
LVPNGRIVRTARADAGHEAVDLNTRELYTRNISTSRYSQAVEILQTVATKRMSPTSLVKRFGHLFRPDRAVPPASGVLTPRLDRRITAAVFDALGLKGRISMRVEL